MGLQTWIIGNGCPSSSPIDEENLWCKYWLLQSFNLIVRKFRDFREFLTFFSNCFHFHSRNRILRPQINHSSAIEELQSQINWMPVSYSHFNIHYHALHTASSSLFYSLRIHALWIHQGIESGRDQVKQQIGIDSSPIWEQYRAKFYQTNFYPCDSLAREQQNL